MDKRKRSKGPDQFSCVYDKQGFIGVLTIAGVLTTDRLQEIHRRLIDAMVDTDFVVVNLDRASNVDGDFFALFCMAARRAYNENKRLHLGRATPEQQIAASKMCTSNFSETERQDCAMHCFWLDQYSGDGIKNMSTDRRRAG